MRMIAMGSVVAIVALLGATWWFTQNTGGDEFAQCRSTTIAEGAATIGGPFTLVSETGETVTETQVLTEPSLIYFGYTFCPDVCPLDNVRNAEAVEILEAEGMSVQPVFITVDPARDTPEVMADYTDAMHPRMLGLTGSPEQTDAAAKAYRAYYNPHGTLEDDEFYLVDHSTFTYLVLPERGFVEFFRRDIAPQEMAETVACFVNNV